MKIDEHDNSTNRTILDAVQGRAPIPRAAATLGLEFIDADVCHRDCARHPSR
jgi:hypothetical protein